MIRNMLVIGHPIINMAIGQDVNIFHKEIVYSILHNSVLIKSIEGADRTVERFF